MSRLVKNWLKFLPKSKLQPKLGFEKDKTNKNKGIET